MSIFKIAETVIFYSFFSSYLFLCCHVMSGYFLLGFRYHIYKINYEISLTLILG